MNLDPFGDPFKSGLGFTAASDLFSLRRKFVGGHRPRKPEPAPQQEPEEELVEDKPQEKAQEKVVLKNPKWEAETVGFNEETPVSVEVVLPEAHKNKKKVLFELYALTPKDPERISQAEGYEENGKATARIPVYQPGYRDEEGELLLTVDYYFTAKHSQSDLLKDETVKKTVEGKADRVIESHVMEDTTFDTDSSFLHPRNAPQLKALGERVAAWREKYPEGTLAIFGHTDAVGKESYNKGLSERRAKSLHAFMVKDASVPEALYNEEKWGLKAVQELLKHLGHDPGAIDGIDGPKTQGAVKAFQEKQGLTVDGKAGPKTREALFKAFADSLHGLKLEAKVFEDIAGNPFTGCSEFNLLEDTQGALEKNRRVTVLLLKSTKKFPLNYPCKPGDVEKCKAQVKKDAGKRRKPSFKCCFYDELVKEEGGGGGGGGAKGELDLPDYDPGKVEAAEPSGCATEEDFPGGGGGGGGGLPVFAKAISWNVEKARCGGTVKIAADSELPEGSEVVIKFSTAELKCDEAKAQVKGGKIEHEWKVKGIGFAQGKDKKLLPEVEVFASFEHGGEKAAPEKPLKVLTVVESKPYVFDKKYVWGPYGVHAHFTQAVSGQLQKVLVNKKVMKSWGATYVNVSGAKITGSTPDFPWEGHRWARSKKGHMVPDEYWDGKAWKSIPKGVTSNPRNFGTLPLIKTGEKFHWVENKSYVWPGKLKDYDFDGKEFSDKRKAWMGDCAKRWSAVFKLRRKACASPPETACCTYGFQLDFQMERAESWNQETLCLAPGELRSNAGLLFYGDSRLAMAAHEVGHLVGLPDEYDGGAVDPAINGDGAKNGLDPTTLMGSSLESEANNKIKARHFINFAEMAKRIYKDVAGPDEEWVAVK